MSNVRSQCKPIIRPSTHSDCMALAQVMRREDIAEISAASTLDPYEALKHGLEISCECYTVVWEGRVAIMFGVIPDRGRHSIWLLASDEFLRFTFHFIKECRKWLNKFLRKYGALYGAVWEENVVHVKFLRWLGFEFFSEPLILRGGRFLVFSLQGET